MFGFGPLSSAPIAALPEEVSSDCPCCDLVETPCCMGARRLPRFLFGTMQDISTINGDCACSNNTTFLFQFNSPFDGPPFSFDPPQPQTWLSDPTNPGSQSGCVGPDIPPFGGGIGTIQWRLICFIQIVGGGPPALSWDLRGGPAQGSVCGGGNVPPTCTTPFVLVFDGNPPDGGGGFCCNNRVFGRWRLIITE